MSVEHSLSGQGLIIEQGIVMPDADYKLIRVGSLIWKYGRFTAIVDAADYENLYWRDWCVKRARSGNYYAWTFIRGRGKVFMHRLIMDVVGREYSDLVVDHKDGFGLNNRRYNLRVVTPEVNQENRKEWTIERNKRTKLWDVIVTSVDGSRLVLGPYHSYNAAHEERWEKKDYWKHWGDFPQAK